MDVIRDPRTGRFRRVNRPLEVLDAVVKRETPTEFLSAVNAICRAIAARVKAGTL